MTTDAEVPVHARRSKSIFDSIIAKWSCAALLEDSGDDKNPGVLSEDESEDESDESDDDYDYSDDLIDNSELQRVFVRKCRAKKSEFRMADFVADGSQMESMEEDANGSDSIFEDEGLAEDKKKPRHVHGRIKQLTWFGCGSKFVRNFKQEKAVTDKILLKIGENGESLLPGGCRGLH